MSKKGGPKSEPEAEKQESSEADPKETSGSVGDVVNTIEHSAQEAVETVYKYAKNVKLESVAYVILAVGLVLIPFYPLWGGALIGLIFGAHYSDTIVEAIKRFRSYFEAQSRAKSISLGGVVLALLITLPTLFLGAAAAIGIVSLVSGVQSSEGKKK